MIAEPIASLTDYGIALECFLFARLLTQKGRHGWLWAAAFGSVSIAALSGGTYHGFVDGLSLAERWLLWRVTVWALAIASFFIILAAASKTPRTWRIGLLTAAAVQIALSLRLGGGAAAFAVSAADYLSALGIALIVQGWRSQQQRRVLAAERSETGFVWIASGLALSGVAITILILPWPYALSVSPLAGYHLMQMVALYCIYRSARADANFPRATGPSYR